MISGRCSKTKHLRAPELRDFYSLFRFLGVTYRDLHKIDTFDKLVSRSKQGAWKGQELFDGSCYGPHDI